MLTPEIQEKYYNILKEGKTLKLDALDAIDLVEKYEDLKKADQIGKLVNSELFKEQMKICNDKIVMMFFTLWGANEQTILYWCPCSLNSIIALAGASDYDVEANVYKTLSWVQRNQQLSFLGKDIKKACSRIETNNKLMSEFVEKYVNTDHPIADNIFYTIYIKTSNNRDEQSINCARNTTLSPRPEKKKS